MDDAELEVIYNEAIEGEGKTAIDGLRAVAQAACPTSPSLVDLCPCDRGSNTTPDPVNHPNHYTFGKVECIDALEAATSGLTGIEAICTANAIKYLWRWKMKNGAEDLRKARWYIDRLLGDA